ncbi:transposase family protein [Actinomyces sp. 432]|uniref:transposase family protein n=1 Tax=Actinomyces sp. 432 TaxID=2057798 RepID=UPI00192A417F|nr:transposase family protein [Actinomyces sp. 432]
MTTPVKKLRGPRPHENDMSYNASADRIRFVVETTIATLKTWRVLHSGYRHPIQAFLTTITGILTPTFTYTP